MTRTRIIAILIATAMLLVTMGGCTLPTVPSNETGTPSVTSAPAAEPSASQIVRGGKLVIGKGQKVTTLNPTRCNGKGLDDDVYVMVYEPLVHTDAAGNLVPGLATSWEFLDDKTIAFELKQGVKFHDGTDFNAEAVKYVMDWYISEECNPIFKNEIAELQSIEVTGPYSVVFHLSAPSSALLTSLATYASLMISPAAIEKYGDELATHAVGTGPFKVTEYVEGDHVSLVRNENYHVMGEDGKLLPYLDAIEVKIIPDDTVKATSLASGDIQLTDYLTSTSIKMLESNRAKTVEKLPSGDYYVLFPNTKTELFANKKVRQAIAYALNRQEIVDMVTMSLGETANWCAVKTQWFWDEYNPYTYDPEKAKALLAEAGYPNGFSFTLSCISREPDNTIMAVVQQQLKAVGIDVKLESMERLAWLDLWLKQKTGDMGMAKGNFPAASPYTQINNNYGITGTNNYSQYAGEEYNELVAQIKAEYDQKKAKELFAKAQKVYLDDSASIFMYSMPRYVAYDNSLQNFSTYYQGAWKLDQAWLKK